MNNEINLAKLAVALGREAFDTEGSVPRCPRRSRVLQDAFVEGYRDRINETAAAIATAIGF